MTRADIPLLRLAAQRLATPPLPSPVDAVRWMTALQGQDYRGGLMAIALRSGADRVSVEAALDAGAVVRSWPMRGTLHFVAAEDLGWMLAVAAPRVVSGTAARRRGLELDDATVSVATDAAVEAMTSGHGLTRAELFALWEKLGIVTSGQRGIHIILLLALTGVVCLGPVDGNGQRFVLLDEWVTAPRELDRDEALGEWALRFFRSHGPASLQDFARWTKLPLGDSRAGLAIAREHLERIDTDGVERWMDPQTPALLAQHRKRARGVFLLPGFDEYVLGYADRSTIIASEYADLVVPGNNGVFQHSVVDNGQVVGTWKRARVKGRDTIVATPFTTFSPRVLAEIDRQSASVL